jgi:DNA-binding response OmpR family regulator
LVDLENPDVVLLDLGLPDKEDGLTIARWLKQRSADRPIVMAVTGYGGDQDESESLQAGTDLHMLKPVNPHKLLDFLDRACQLRPAADG